MAKQTRLVRMLLYVTLLLIVIKVPAQRIDSITNEVFNTPDKLIKFLEAKTISTQENLTKATSKYLRILEEKERKLAKKVRRADVNLYQSLFADNGIDYKSMLQKLNQPITGEQSIYNGHLDSMRTLVSFLKTYNWSSSDILNDKKFNSLIKNYNNLNAQLTQVNQIEQILIERQRELKEKLASLGFMKEIKKIQEFVYYYRTKVNEYRELWDNPSRIEAKLLKMVMETSIFKDFFAKHSELGRLFPMPAFATAKGGAITGIPTRDEITNDIVQRFGSEINFQQTVSQGIGQAEEQMNELRAKLEKLGTGGSEMEMPNFKPNVQKTKSFFRRFELGTNFQNTRGNNFYPVTSDIGISLGYKLNNVSVIGLGGSYKIGWGQNIQHIRVSSEGASIRSFIDVKLKGSFFITGGLEYNYQQPFTSFQQIDNLDSWQQSGLVGLSKIVSLRTKFFKKTKLQLLWDVLSYQQIPRTQPLKFRVGYTL